VNIDLTALTTDNAFCSFFGTPPRGGFGFELLGYGEYNINYLFQSPLSGEKLVFRIPMGSQMHLDNQVRYEFEALRLLEKSGRTPKPLYIDDGKKAIPRGFLVMEFLPGRALDYRSDLEQAAMCLADIHGLKIQDENHLLVPEDPLSAVLEECFAMSKHYLESGIAVSEVKKLIQILLESGLKIVEGSNAKGRRCLVNTELNSGNFLVNADKTYLVDWEKPIFAYRGQDLGHFLAPTTTLWKTDSVLTETMIQGFIKNYCDASGGNEKPELLWAEAKPYFVMNCLRGVTWCSMAWTEYQSPDRLLKDTFTFEKIKSYLEPEFLEMIRRDYLG